MAALLSEKSLNEGQLIESGNKQLILVRKSKDSNELVAVDVEILAEFGKASQQKLKPFNATFSQNQSKDVVESLLNDIIDIVVSTKCADTANDLMIDLSKTSADEIFKTVYPAFNLNNEFDNLVAPTEISTNPQIQLVKKTTQMTKIVYINSRENPIRKLIASSKNPRVKIRPKPIIRRPPLNTRFNLQKQEIDCLNEEIENVQIPTIDYSIQKPRSRKQKFQLMDIGEITEEKPKKIRGQKRKYQRKLNKVPDDTSDVELQLQIKAQKLVAKLNIGGTDQLARKTNYQCTYCFKYLKNSRTLGKHIKTCPKFQFEVDEFLDKICHVSDNESDSMAVENEPVTTVTAEVASTSNVASISNTEPKVKQVTAENETNVKEDFNLDEILAGCSTNDDAKDKVDLIIKELNDSLHDVTQEEPVESLQMTHVASETFEITSKQLHEDKFENIERELAEMSEDFNDQQEITTPAPTDTLLSSNELLKILTDVMESEGPMEVQVKQQKSQDTKRKRGRSSKPQEPPSKKIVLDDGNSTPTTSHTKPGASTANSTRKTKKEPRLGTRRSLRKCH